MSTLLCKKGKGVIKHLRMGSYARHVQVCVENTRVASETHVPKRLREAFQEVEAHELVKLLKPVHMKRVLVF